MYECTCLQICFTKFHLVNGRASSTRLMLRTFGSDLTSLINSDLAWKVSKGRSSSRRARKTLAKSSKGFTMPVSEPQKKGVAALGCRFSEKAEHVPIKKRRFMFRSPSPPPVIASETAEETVISKKNEEISKGVIASKSDTCEINPSLNIDNNTIVGDKKSDQSDGKIGEDQDFSGISILAAAACSSSMGRECGYAEQSAVVEESSMLHKTGEVTLNAKTCSFSKELLKEDLLSSSEMSTGGTLSCISTEPVRELASNSTAVNFPSEIVTDGKYPKGVPMAADSTSSGKVSCSMDKEMVGNQRSSSRDVKFHWDLNVVMDAWEEPLGDSDAPNHVPNDVPHGDKNNDLDSHGKQTTGSLILGKTKPSINHASGGLKSQQDGIVHPNIEQHVHLANAACGAASAGTRKASDAKVKEMNNIQGANIDRNSAVTIGLSEIPSVTPKESCDPNLGDASKTNLSWRLNYSERDDNGEHAKYNDDVSVRHDDVAVTGTDAKAGRTQEDYDSQYEDGELRDSTECAWQEYDDVDPEYELVDYGSGNIDPSDHYDSESGQVDHYDMTVGFGDCYADNEVSDQGLKSIKDDKGANIKLGLSAAEEMEVPRGTELRESSTGLIDENGRKDSLARVDELVVSKDTDTREEPKMFRRPLQSRIEGANFRDGTSRDERSYRFENRFEGSTRSFERGRHSYHNRGRGRQSGGWDGTSDYRRGYKRHYSPINHRRSKLDGEAVTERDDDGFDEEPCPGSQSHYRPDRKFSPDRGAGFRRGRPFRYGPLNDNRAGRGRYNGPSPDESFQSSLKYRRPLSRRERSLSPFAGRGHSRGKSPSQSRSRSPIVWGSPRERPGPGRGGRTFIRHRSRSPNFRSEFRIQRPRSPNQQPGYRGGHASGFRSITRTHSSPPRNRWNSARKDDVEQFGEFKSPGKFRPRGDNDNSIDSSRNQNPGGYRRFSDRISEDGAGRGQRYGNTYEERKKPGNFLRPARRSYDDGMGSKMLDDVDGFHNRNNFRNSDALRFRGRGGFRSNDSHNGDMRRNFRGEHRTFVYERNAKFNSNSKEFTADMDEANQGHRYENYNNRRKPFCSANFVRHSDNEDAKERSNPNADENFQDASDFCGSNARGFEGQVGSSSGRSRDDRDPPASEQEEKRDGNSQAVGAQNSEII